MSSEKEPSFGKRVYNLRKKNGLTQIELSEKIGSSKGTIQNYEAGTLPVGKYAIRLAEIFKCSIDWLLTGKESIYIDSKRQDLPTAKDTIAKLADLERMSERSYRKATAYITEVWETVTDVFEEISEEKKPSGNKNLKDGTNNI
jgi:transcriptional regulator with XRE-family HTH domain